MNSKALLIVDWEKEWTDAKSEYFVGDLSNATKKINKLIAFCRAGDYKIIFIKHVEKDSKEAFAKNSRNVEFMDGLDIKKSDTIITKYKISPFFKTNLDAKLKGVKEVVVAGILTNLCVRSSIQDAYDRGFEITVIKDCCKALDDEAHRFTIKDLKATRDEITFLNLKKILSRS